MRTKEMVAVIWAKYWNFIVSVLVAGVVVLGLYLKHDALTGQAIRDAAIAFLITLLITFTFRVNALQITLESRQDVVGKLLDLLAMSPKIRKTVEYAHLAHLNENQFNRFFIDEVISGFNDNLHSISQGRYRCSADAEITVTKTILQCCNKSLKAISYEDEVWWLSNNSTLYMDAHAKHIDRKREKAIRIFLIASGSMPNLKEVFAKHKELEIETYVLFTDKDRIDEKYKKDFVIYDDFMLRTASEVKNKEGGKEAVFTIEDGLVGRHLTLFEELLTLAKSRANPLA